MDEDDHEGARARPPQQALLVAAVAVLAIVLALAAGAAAGPWRWPDPDRGDPTPPPGTGVPTILPTRLLEEHRPDDTAAATGENPFVRWLIIATVAAIGLLLILLLVRLGLMLRRGKLPPPDPRQVSTPLGDELIDAPAIQEGIAAAQQALADDRPPRDAIVRAWLALETAAGDAGAARRPSQTPTEFASLVLARTSADDAAVETLRRLYTRSRFSEAEVTRRDAELAREALERIATSWSAVRAPS